LSQVAEINSGGRLFSNFLATTFNIDEEGARVLKENYSNKTLSNSAINKIKEKLRPLQKKWYEDLKREIEKIAVGKITFSNICIFGGGSLLFDIQEILQSELGPGLIVEHLLPKDLEDIKDQTRALNSPQNTPSLLICYH